ncbi:MAG: hypothetical protein GMKNLPBB_00494 [Myxococcota bacterium]|nr:hypothetical protein [Myxococcota bacterium]
MMEAIFTQRWPFWAGGPAIGLVVLAMLLAQKKPLGVSTGFLDACAAVFNAECRKSWRLPFLAGVIGGGFLSGLLDNGFALAWSVPEVSLLQSIGPIGFAGVLFGGGVLIGLGSRLAGGCTSGNGIVGMANLSPQSIVATVLFMAAGFAVTHLLYA